MSSQIAGSEDRALTFDLPDLPKHRKVPILHLQSETGTVLTTADEAHINEQPKYYAERQGNGRRVSRDARTP